ncbi:MAG: hypothetical protein DRP97_07770 [Candidatus Latescibacterota bacterium]|nr:MAG: hypothetical protein DRP97_07770 [Candidatus Latescibacterota bacterium]
MFFLDCFAIDILSLTGQNPDYSQILDDATRFQAFLKKTVLKPEIQKFLLHKSKKGFWSNL